MKSRVVPWAVFLLAAVFVPSTACTLFVNSDAAQCESDVDCVGRGPAFEGTSCGPRKTCIPLEGYCSTNQECIARGGSEAYACKRGQPAALNRCVSLLSPECPKLLADPGDLADDEALIVGSMWMPSWNPILKSGEDGLDLARQDFRRAQGGIPQPTKKARPVVVVACDVPIAQQDKHKNATDHLVDIGVPVMFGPLTADWISYALKSTIPKGIVVLSPDALPRDFTAGTADGLFFTNGVPAGYAHSTSLLVNVHEDLLRAGGKTGEIKVALLTTGLASDFQVASDFYKDASFNGKPAKDNGANYLEVAFGDLSQVSTPQQSVDFARAITTLQTFKPDVVACVASGCDKIAVELEKTLHPRYIFSSINANSAVAQFFDTQPDGRKRVLGTRPGRPENDDRVRVFYNRFKAVYPEATEPGLAAQMYDLFYYMAYAASSLGADPITGKAVGRAILDRFNAGGKLAKTTPDSILGAVQTLTSGNNLAMDGTQTAGIFTPSGTLAVFELTAWCFSDDTAGITRVRDSGLSFKSDVAGVRGTLNCF